MRVGQGPTGDIPRRGWHRAAAIKKRAAAFGAHGETMQRSEHRILTTHAGSLPRPAELTRLFALRARGEAVDESEIERAGRAAVRESVKKQIENGLDVIDDGEQSRKSFVLYMRHRLTGLGGEGGAADACRPRRLSAVQAAIPAARDLAGQGVEPHAPAEGDRRRRPTRTVARSRPNAPTSARRSTRQRRPCRGLPDRAVARHHRVDRAERALRHVRALSGRARAPPCRSNTRRSSGSGFLLQLDCPDLALERHTSYRDRPLADFLAFVDLIVAAINKALRNIPRDQVRLHVCWGNYEGPHDHDVALRDILPSIQQANVGALLPALRQSAPRARVSRVAEMPLRDDQFLVAGVIDTLTNFVEHPEVVADRIERIAAVVGDPSRVLAGDGLRIRHLSRDGPRRGGRGLGQAARHARRRQHRVGTAVQVGNETMLKIWGRTNSINVQKVMWTVAELGLAHERANAGMAHGGRQRAVVRADQPEQAGAGDRRRRRGAVGVERDRALSGRQARGGHADADRSAWRAPRPRCGWTGSRPRCPASGRCSWG